MTLLQAVKFRPGRTEIKGTLSNGEEPRFGEAKRTDATSFE